MGKSNAVQKKVENLYALMDKLARGEELYPQNVRIQEELGVDERTLRRYLEEEIYPKYSHIVVTEKKKVDRGGRRVTVYRVADRERDVSEIFRFFIESSDDLSWLLQLVHENDPSLLKGYAKESRRHMESILKDQERVFRFVGSPFENLDDVHLKDIFSRLKNAVKNREYRTVVYKKGGRSETLEDIKCLKLFHMSDNWYLACEMNDGSFRFLRLAFIEDIQYANKKKVGYRRQVLEKYEDFFKKVQNPMTLFGPFERAVIVASPRVAFYFDEGMKPFFPTQRFVGKLPDGSVEFTLEYTQPMEILPFVKRWMPDLTIREPESLREALKKDLEEGLKRLA
ncbi:helix-turn-helix transcriptional regulator [Hydrogenimonas cancrithermarum]|uniref:WYL domain-containing protein n=1 Tax=Hydrogenimonas cancrithermarum TaxID=2993563 RepID=A0ABN6WSQ6_9BACT|nr:WYL domain-containing protein [Hydrogenimonas cancrithermarum]BDY11973.1 hypothetical protein HCR_02850 [Hydrogenimonas cancrithermarum]